MAPTIQSRPSQEQRILMLLQATSGWVPAPVLARVSLQYSARIFSLRRQGWLIENEVRVVDGVRHGYFRLGGNATPRTTLVSPPIQLPHSFPKEPPVERTDLFPEFDPPPCLYRDPEEG